MNDNQARHCILETIIILVHNVKKPILKTPVNVDSILKFYPKNRLVLLKAIRYLMASEYLLYNETPSTSDFVITQKGIDAFNSEYFKEASSKESQKFWNSVITLIFSGLITVATVALVFKKDQDKPSQELQQIQQKVQEQTKVIDSIQTFLHRNYLMRVDSIYAPIPHHK